MKTDTTPEISFIPATTTDHFKQIIELQKQNLYNAISTEQQAQEGFVFAEHTVSLITINGYRSTTDHRTA